MSDFSLEKLESINDYFESFDVTEAANNRLKNIKDSKIKERIDAIFEKINEKL